jgi:uncharacterized protein (TIGR03083 family)
MSAWDRDAAVAAYVDALEGMRSLAHDVDASQWGAATDCPGWTVQDHFSHVASIESTLLARPDPEHEPDYEALPHVGDDPIKRHLERGVDLRRNWTPEAVRAELDEVVGARLVEVAALSADPEAPILSVLGKLRPAAGVVAVRTFDVWAHEQDVRRAVDLPQRLTGPAAEASRDRILRALPDIVGELGLHEGTTVRWIVTGPLTFSSTVTVTDEGALADDDEAEADATLTMDWPTFVLLACGRVAPSHLRVAVDGDVALAEKVLPAMAITP